MKSNNHRANQTTKQLVINYHMTERCNYDCHYCYAKWEQPHEIHKTDGAVDMLLERLADHFLQSNAIQDALGYESVRLNFAGGEPMLLKHRFTHALDMAQRLGFKTSLITNGHLIDDDFIQQHAAKMALLGISFDASQPDVQQSVGRMTRSGAYLSSASLIRMGQQLRQFAPETKLKINTVVNRHNLDENLTDVMRSLQPSKWKVLRVLPVFESIPTVTDEEFERFVKRHQSVQSIMSIENNDTMTGSYLMVSPDGRFYQNGGTQDGYLKSRSLLSTPIAMALAETGFHPEKFARRYDDSE
ncbi:viperin family antiviral radical SAM protein [Enterovibrio baiacu]|uniref:viperin family antiviral radical SAM protein n=1 Tax=Enterovibrio baiacu TaxID=2491023 RepID=UPI001010B5CF|nr:viperin family antiviral radical SAM protein [Enterovibrio baiacu]MBE1275022.1 radical SAM protein [Enterovibrio baiacu]